ncbi:hypothetical protein [Alicyclobacillus shizuokensis]|uniref:hypothetical protein n=1 Tax=Alicyclobacillus shizuokensis TaxID=392014 RepID=UPI0008373B07|nr:hypothetical protein [Alicyclobacillus shizuokensis]MCL6626058.1 hypothetical protein [Alicyclobacillus shizuokensis]
MRKGTIAAWLLTGFALFAAWPAWTQPASAHSGLPWSSTADTHKPDPSHPNGTMDKADKHGKDRWDTHKDGHDDKDHGQDHGDAHDMDDD